MERRTTRSEGIIICSGLFYPLFALAYPLIALALRRYIASARASKRRAPAPRTATETDSKLLQCQVQVSGYGTGLICECGRGSQPDS